MPNLDFPFGFDGRGGTATAAYDDHVRDMIEQILFTRPGERVNRPDFGSGLLHQVFEPNSDERAATLQFTTQAGLQRWLGDLIEVDEMSITADDATMRVVVRYRLRRTQEPKLATFERSVP